jgi:hypothetical protein
VTARSVHGFSQLYHRSTHEPSCAIVQLPALIRSGALTTAVALTVACSAPPAAAPAAGSPDASAPTQSVSLGDTLRIELGRSASVDGGRLVVKFVSRGADSRCPANVVCVWQGDVAVRIAARVGNTTVERELHTGLEPHSLTVARYVVTLVGLLPYPGTEAANVPSARPTALLRATRA